MPERLHPEPKILHIPDTFDTVLQKQELREYAERHYPKVGLARLNRNRTNVDGLYNETSDPRFHDPEMVFCYVDHEPTKKSLIKYGLDQTRDVMFQIATLHLDDLGILENNDTFLIGDLIHWGDDFYEIKDQSRDTESYWINTNIPFYLVLGADLYREGQ